MNIHVSRQPEALKIAKKTSHSAKTSLKWMTLWGLIALVSGKGDKATAVNIVKTEALHPPTINKPDMIRLWNSKSNLILMAYTKMIETKGQSWATVLVLVVAEVRGEKVNQETKKTDLIR